MTASKMYARAVICFSAALAIALFALAFPRCVGGR